MVQLSFSASISLGHRAWNKLKENLTREILKAAINKTSAQMLRALDTLLSYWCAAHLYASLMLFFLTISGKDLSQLTSSKQALDNVCWREAPMEVDQNLLC